MRPARLLGAPQVAHSVSAASQALPASSRAHTHLPSSHPHHPPESRPQLPVCPDTCAWVAFSLECPVYIASFIALNVPTLPLSTWG